MYHYFLDLYHSPGVNGHGIKQLQHMLSCNMKIYLHEKIHIELRLHPRSI